MHRNCLASGQQHDFFNQDHVKEISRLATECARKAEKMPPWCPTTWVVIIFNYLSWRPQTRGSQIRHGFICPSHTGIRRKVSTGNTQRWCCVPGPPVNLFQCLPHFQAAAAAQNGLFCASCHIYVLEKKGKGRGQRTPASWISKLFKAFSQKLYPKVYLTSSFWNLAMTTLPSARETGKWSFWLAAMLASESRRLWKRRGHNGTVSWYLAEFILSTSLPLGPLVSARTSVIPPGTHHPVAPLWGLSIFIISFFAHWTPTICQC